MELKTRLDVLIQVAKLAQKNGLLSLDDACVVKHTIDEVENNTNLKENVEVLSNVALLTQNSGKLSLKDAYYVYLALEDINNVIELEGSDETPVTVEETSTKKTKKTK